MSKTTHFNKLKKIFARLHGKNGCSWDKKQTHKTLIPYLREEIRELIEAINHKDTEHIKEELGDILLHVMFQAQIAQKKGLFDIEDVIEELIDKLKRRHPHVFGKVKVRSTKEILHNWKKIKKQEQERNKVCTK
ncbi:MAG: MazG family protein [Candidatus Omnitrophica bacterium]|nr:MazG family protein [Candidatus Omnitrophota bacterium]